MPLPTQSDVGWKVAIVLVFSVAAGFTIIRLWDRFRKRMLWWDDYLTVLPLISTFLYVLTTMIRIQNGVYRQYENFFFSTWWVTFLYYTSIWVSRISLCLSVARLFPQSHRPRQFAYGFAGLFFIIYFTSSINAAVMCTTPGRPWYHTTLKLCSKTKSGVLIGSIVAMAFDFLADTLLVVFPIVVLRRVKLPARERRLILGLFCSSIVSFSAAIYFQVLCLTAVKIGRSAPIMLSIASQLQAAISLLVCNLLIVTMFFYRIIRKIREAREARTAPAATLGLSVALETTSDSGRPETKTSDLYSSIMLGRAESTSPGSGQDTTVKLTSQFIQFSDENSDSV